MRGRQPVEADIFGLKATAQPLLFPDSQAILPEVMTIVAIGMRELGSAVMTGVVKLDDDVVKLLPALVPITQHFENGYLARIAPKILACTTVVMPDFKGDLSKFELSKEADRSAVFNDYPEAYLPMLFFAGRVTFGRFFPESVLLAMRERAAKAKAASTPAVSSPST